MKYILAFLLFFVAPTAVQATEYGPFICRSSCLLLGPTPDGDTQAFISNTVNSISGPTTGYKMGDRVVVCDGTTCATYSRAMFGFVLVARGPDRHNPYLNVGINGGGAPIGSGSTGGGGSIGIIGYNPVYGQVSVCTEMGCTVTSVIVGYDPVFGPRPQ